MAIYTRTGDKGTTSVWGGRRVSKADRAIEASGSIDELTSWIGYVALHTADRDITGELEKIQGDLYQIMAKIAGADIPIAFLVDRTKDFEQKIDHITAALPPLDSFILPGGTVGSSHFHILRVVTRTAERRVVSLRTHTIIVAYLNRLSDLFFTFARAQSKSTERRVGRLRNNREKGNTSKGRVSRKRTA